ncbi:MAG: thermonuclease family protein [Rhizobiales bacterium]|nr:thermonuclease family protein [Hyphomicrobiales bacterium]
MRLKDYLKTLIFLLSVGFAVYWFSGSSWEKLDGFVVVDGDSLKQGDKRYRLVGIDAPELNQTCVKYGKAVPCGQQAKRHLQALLEGQNISCASEGNDKYGRILVECQWDTPQSSGEVQRKGFPGFTNSINAQMVFDGWAIAYGAFRPIEVAAVLAKRGIWSTEFDTPQEYRRKHDM